MKRRIVIAGWLLLLLLPAAVAARTPQRAGKEVAAIENYVRGVKRQAKALHAKLRVFADTNRNDSGGSVEWREFSSVSARAKQGDFYENAEVITVLGQPIVAYFLFQSPSGDWAHYITYYFRRDGSLAKIEARLNTFYGKLSVVRERFYDLRGKLLHSSIAYYELDAPQKPTANRDFLDQPIPFYRHVRQLPFYKLL